MNKKETLNEIMQSSLDWQNVLDSSIWQNRAILFIMRALYALAEIMLRKEKDEQN